MGKAARRERRALSDDQQPPEPIWVGANGFDQAWKLTQEYIVAGNKPWDPALDDRDRSFPELLHAKHMLGLGIKMSSLQLHMLQSMMRDYHKEYLDKEATDADKGKVVDYLDKQTPQSWLDKHTHAEIMGPAIGKLGREHQHLLSQSTPLLFDPLLSPILENEYLETLRLPFQTTTCDFLGDTGMSMPIMADENSNKWIGLICATITQLHPGAFDVWPVITPLDPSTSEYHQKVEPWLMGIIRIGKNILLPQAPPGMVHVDLARWVGDNKDPLNMPAQAWVLETEHTEGSNGRL